MNCKNTFFVCINLDNLLILTILIQTLAGQSWKAATRNPVEALRYE